ncbi:MAG: hypothetical protein JWO30_4103 [Fibrobacteres bacterium]|nr:hypothetical protein [Fibrobacterota bacterium]
MKIVTDIMTRNRMTNIRGEFIRKAILQLAIAAMAAFFTTGCMNDEDPAAPTAQADSANMEQKLAFKAGQDLWKESRPPAYSYQLSRNCFCFPYGWMEIFVDGDQVVKVDTIPGVEGPYDLESFDKAPSVEEVFKQIEGYLNNPEYEVTASYDDKLGYPTSVKIHHLIGYNDEDAEFQIASLRP